MRPEHWLFTIPLRVRSLFRRAQADQALDDELRDHLELATAEYVAKGMAQDEAHRRARMIWTVSSKPKRNAATRAA